ncbi:MAG: hypothetical protein JST30_09625 [Armatimonadetes bacterium]|nr:hypothetical protein [Armatimonadota bacterium]
MFCRETVSDLAKLRPKIDAVGTQLAFVHQGSEAEAAAFFRPFGLGDVLLFSDPERELYAAFGLGTYRFRDVLSWESVTGGVRAAWKGHRQGVVQGDPLQSSGAFLIVAGRVVRSARSRGPSFRPGFLAFAVPPGHP